MMQTFTAWEYLLIDTANHYGLDKEVYNNRIQWTLDNLNQLESLVDSADNKPLFVKAVQAIRKVQRGEPTGHLVGFDSVCSGMQIMSAITGCKSGAKATGLINTGLRPDAYTEGVKIMSNILGSDVTVERSKIKKAIMTVLNCRDTI